MPAKESNSNNERKARPKPNSTSDKQSNGSEPAEHARLALIDQPANTELAGLVEGPVGAEVVGYFQGKTGMRLAFRKPSVEAARRIHRYLRSRKS